MDKDNLDKMIDRVARAICREKCAFYGEPPCFDIGPEYFPQEWQPETCDEPGCMALAKAAIAGMAGK